MRREVEGKGGDGGWAAAKRAAAATGWVVSGGATVRASATVAKGLGGGNKGAEAGDGLGLGGGGEKAKAPSTSFIIVGRAAPTLSATLSAAAAPLSHARGSYCHHPHARRR